MQKLITNEIVNTTPGLYETDGVKDPIVTAHFFSCFGNWDWYMIEYDADERVAFGLCKGFETELGYFSVAEFDCVNKDKGFNFVERDEHWEPKRLSEVRMEVA